jgi:hypothetical protein
MGWYSAGIKNSAVFRSKINTLSDPTMIRAAVEEFFVRETVGDL